jgi:hypothetical protein
MTTLKDPAYLNDILASNRINGFLNPVQGLFKSTSMTGYIRSLKARAVGSKEETVIKTHLGFLLHKPP